MGFALKGYVLEPPRIGSQNSPFTQGPNNFVPQTLLAATFTLTTGSQVATFTGSVGALVPGDTIVFLSQLGVTYNVTQVGAGEITMFQVYSGVFQNNGSPVPFGTSSAYCPQIGPEVAAYNAAYPPSEENPRDDYLVLVTSELAPGAGTPFTISDVQNFSGLIQITTIASNIVVNGQTVVITEVNGVPGANGTFTVSVLDPTDFVLNGSVFSGTYGGGGSALVVQGGPGLLTNAGFGWTKNEVIQRLDYDSLYGRFRTLPGGPIVVAGLLSSSNPPAQLTVTPPLESFADLPAAPYRLSVNPVGAFGSGTTWTVDIVATDADFTSPPPGTAQLSLATGDLNWNASDDIITFNGQQVSWQQQQYFALGTSTGNIGTLLTLPATPTVLVNAILLNPVPAHGQSPLIRIGYLYWLTTVERSNEGHFTPPTSLPSGTVEWALTTGRLNFSSVDIETNVGTSIYYDGTLFARDLTLPRMTLGAMPAYPATLGPINTPIPATGDIIFSVASNPLTGTPYTQFNYFSVVGAFDGQGGTGGTVEILQSSGVPGLGSGLVQFSSADSGAYLGQIVTVVFGDLPIDHGISIRFFRCPVNLNAQTSGVKDVTAIYDVENAVWASPIMGAPIVFLPSIPVDDDTLVISVGQGTGTFTGVLNPVGGPSPIAGLGYTIDFDNVQLTFAERFDGVEIQMLVPAGYVQLPNSMVLTTNIDVALETGTATNVFLPLTVGVDCLIDGTGGFVYFITTFGVLLGQGSTATFSGTTFTDLSADFTVENVAVGDFLLVLSDTADKAQGVYTIVAVPTTTTLTVDMAPPAGSGKLNYQILQGEEILADRFFQTVQLQDPTTSVERIDALGTIQNASTIVASSTATFPNQQTLQDLTTNFITAGVQPGDTITLTSGPGSGSTYLVLEVATNVLTPSVNFVQVISCTYEVMRRLQVPLAYVNSVRFRYGLPTPAAPSGIFSTSVIIVATDSAFSAPSSLPQGTVQISQATGNLNFAQADVTNGGTVYVSRLLALGTDYQVNAGLGLINFTQRMLTNEEVLLTYTTAPPSTTPPTPPGPPNRNERGTFLVRKEVTQPHPQPTNTLTFNPTGKQVAGNPSPSVWRGGRPQFVNTGSPQSQGQIALNITSTPPTITFLPDTLLLAQQYIYHGATVQPSENVYIDYYVYQAMGGEQTLTVLNPPMMVASVAIIEGTNAFLIAGNQTAVFPAGFLMVVNNAEVYAIGSSVYDPTAQYTTITLSGSQEFQSDQTNPPLQVASGLTPLTGTALVPAYFTMELAPYYTVARGSASIFIPDNKTGIYQANVVLFVTDSVSSFTDYYLVTSSKYVAGTNQTQITLATNTIRQYTFGQQILYFSVRPIYAQAPQTVRTSRTPITIPSPQPVTVIRRVAGQVGQILTTPVGYTIDASGSVTYLTPLQPNEEFTIFYTGHRVITWSGSTTGLPGPRVSVSYTATIVPDLATNGLLGQVLNANYTIFGPDNFYYRVETMSNFKLQVAQEIQQAAQTQSTTGGSGPMTSNTTTPLLYQQGNPSIWFPPGDYANHDLIAQAALLYFNNAVNDLEDVLHAIDGRIVGDVDGRFMFDGVIGRYDYYTYDSSVPSPPYPPVAPAPSNILNQIDDLIQIAPGPLPQYPDYLSFFQQAYVTGPTSRFFQTTRNIFAQAPAVVSSSPNDGDIVATYNFSPLTSLPATTFKRFPRAQTCFDTPYGQNTFFVDNVVGDGTFRPAWTPNPEPPASIIGMLVVIEDPQGNFYIDETDNCTVVSVAPHAGSEPAGQITISTIAHDPVGPTGSPPSPTGGTTAFIAAKAGSTVTIAGLGGMGPRQVGLPLTISGAASGGNNGTFTIIAVISLTVVQITNASGHFPDLNSGTITWTVATLGLVPAGSTIYVSPIDVCVAEQESQGVDSGANGTYSMSYQFGKDVNADLTTGNVLYQSPYWPFNGNSTFLLPTFFIPQSSYIIPVENGDILEADGAGVAVTYTAPYQFPALFGSVRDDDGNQSIPIVGPTFDGEITRNAAVIGGALAQEAQYEVPLSPFWTTLTTPPFATALLGAGHPTGSLDATRTIITLSAGAFPSPIPSQYDLVRIVSGLNGTTDWRRIVSVNNTPPGSVTVASADAFTHVDSGFNFAITVSPAGLVSGLGTAVLSGATLTDTAKPFSGGPLTMLGNTYGVMTFTGNSYNTTTLDTIVPIVPASASSPTWGLINPTGGGSAVSVGDIVTGPGIDSTRTVTVSQIGPGASLQLTAPGLPPFTMTGGALTGAVFQIQFTQPPPTTAVVGIVGDTFQLAAGLSGTTASVSSFTTPLATITGLTGIIPQLVGQTITFTGAASSGNNGPFTIMAYISSSSVVIENTGAVAPDANNGAISWSTQPIWVVQNLNPPSTAGFSIGDTVTSTVGGLIPGGTTITQIGPGAQFTLSKPAGSAMSGQPIRVHEVAPPTPWSTTVDSLIANIFPPTQANTDGFSNYPAGTILVSGTGIPYAPPVTETYIETVPAHTALAGYSITMTNPATSSTFTGDPLAGASEIITIFLPPNVYAGWTVVMTSGPNAGYRRQIASVVSPSEITLDSAFPFAGGGTYRIDNPLNTYDGVVFEQINASMVTEINTILNRTAPTPPPYVPNEQSEQNALLAFFTTVFTTIPGWPSSHGSVSGLILTDTTVDFIGPDPSNPIVNDSYLVYVHLGVSGPQLADQGIYAIANVVDSHHLMVTPTFPTSGTITYEIVSVFGISTTTLQNIFSIFAANAAFVTSTEAFQVLMASPSVPPYTGTGNVPVLIGGVVDTSIYANGLNDLTDDLGDRYTVANNRINYLTNASTGPVAYIQAALSTSDNMYAQRYSWINARINLQTGYLILENTAQATMAANQQAVFNQFIQLLTIQNSG